MKTLFAIGVLCAGSFCAGQAAHPSTQSSSPAPHSVKEGQEARQKTDGSLADVEAQVEAEIQHQASISNPAEPEYSQVSKARAEYDEAYWKYQRDAIEHTRRVYGWQHVSSIIIFYVVIFLVLVGLLFSWLQFKAAAYKGEAENLDASMQGIKLTSSTLGVVILVLSMCFFYLYLRYVYPVNVNQGTAMATGTDKTEAH